MLRLKARVPRPFGSSHRTEGIFHEAHNAARVYGIGALCILSVSLAFVFSSITNGAQVMSPSRHISTVSSKGKFGVSAPNGVNSTGKASASSSGAQSAAQGIVTVPVGSKPAWTGLSLYTDPNTTAAQYAKANPSVAGVSLIARMAQAPVAEWFGDWNADVTSDANSYVSAAAALGKVPVLVAYNIPNRDCGGYSVGGAAGVAQYTSWVQKLANGIGNRTAVVILEPDSLGALDCLATSAQSDRLASLSQAVPILKANAKTSVYIDAGTPVWQPLSVMSARLQQANIAAADGFSLNISYFATTALNQTYGDALSKLVGNKHYVIDTSRNGTNQTIIGFQCNPASAALGTTPTTNTGDDRNDALLWIKIPWESDGECNGSPGPGEPYWSYAIGMAQKAGW